MTRIEVVEIHNESDELVGFGVVEINGADYKLRPSVHGGRSGAHIDAEAARTELNAGHPDELAQLRRAVDTFLTGAALDESGRFTNARYEALHRAAHPST